MRKSLHIFFMGVICLAIAYNAARAQSGQPVIPIQSLIEEAFQNNPSVAAAKAAWSQAVEKLPQETALDDPVLSFSYYAENVETRVGPQEYSIGIEQRFPFPGTLHQKGEIAKKEIEIARLQYEKAVRNMIVELKQAVYEHLYIEGAIETTRHNQELLQEILAVAEAGYSRQSTGLNDVFQAESQLAQLDYEIITLRELRSVQIAVINSVLNRPPDTPLPAIAAAIPEPVTFPISALDSFVQENNQDILIAELDVKKADESIQLARSKNRPTFNIGADYIDTGEALNPLTPGSGKDPIIIRGGITIPVWLGKNKARVRYAKEGKTDAVHRGDAVINELEVKLRKTFFDLQNAKRLMVLYDDHLIPQAQNALQTAEEWNRTKQGSISEVLEVQSVWLNFNLAWLRARTDYAKFFAELERIAGGSLSPLLQQEAHDEN